MGIKILHHKRHVDEYEYFLDYRWVDNPHAGFQFPCNEQGELLLDKMEECSMQSYNDCEFGKFKDQVVLRGIHRIHRSYVIPAVGECWCGTEVVLDGFTNTCDGCGKDYNWNGQELASRSQWGEETGEHLSDILRIK